jgi:hypothetical protein
MSTRGIIWPRQHAMSKVDFGSLANEGERAMVPTVPPCISRLDPVEGRSILLRAAKEQLKIR